MAKTKELKKRYGAIENRLSSVLEAVLEAVSRVSGSPFSASISDSRPQTWNPTQRVVPHAHWKMAPSLELENAVPPSRESAMAVTALLCPLQIVTASSLCSSGATTRCASLRCV